MTTFLEANGYVSAGLNLDTSTFLLVNVHVSAVLVLSTEDHGTLIAVVLVSNMLTFQDIVGMLDDTTSLQDLALIITFV